MSGLRTWHDTESIQEIETAAAAIICGATAARGHVRTLYCNSAIHFASNLLDLDCGWLLHIAIGILISLYRYLEENTTLSCKSIHDNVRCEEHPVSPRKNGWCVGLNATPRRERERANVWILTGCSSPRFVGCNIPSPSFRTLSVFFIPLASPCSTHSAQPFLGILTVVVVVDTVIVVRWGWRPGLLMRQRTRRRKPSWTGW